MSLEEQKAKFGGKGFPRVSGDEPADYDALKRWFTFSPRERG